VFLSLARELEAQGVGRKVAADMFGLALRSYQLKITRLAQSASEPERTLWEAVLGYVTTGPGRSRAQIAERFVRDDASDLAAVLRDLVDSGLLSRAGRGDHAFYQRTGQEAVQAMAGQQQAEALANMVWLAIYDHQEVALEALLGELAHDEAAVRRAVESLLADGRVATEQREGGQALVCRRLTIPIGAEQGWEAAVFDHFRAVATAIAAKLQLSGPRSSEADLVGGSTVSFSIRDGHPFEREVKSLLGRVRGDVNRLWSQVAAHNQAHPIDAAERTEVTFYFGQNVIAPGPDGGNGT
jgi:hypothetical protein